MKKHNKKETRNKVIFILTFLVVFSLLVTASSVSALQTFEIQLTIHGLDKKTVTETTPEGYEFQYVDFGDFSVDLDEIYVIQSESTTNDSELDKSAEWVFRAELVSETNTLSTIYFAPSFMILSDPPIEVNESEILLYVPYSADAKFLRVYKGNELKLEVNILKLICNLDSKCNNFETYLSCSSDCKWYSQDTICNSRYDDLYCDPDCEFDTDETDPEAECFNLNCNKGGGLSGAICEKYKCDNSLKDRFEEGIDCGGICPDGCPIDFCGDGICAEYEDNEICPNDCPNKLALNSYIENLDSEPLQGYLIITTEKQINEKWQEHKEIMNDFRDGNLRTIQPYEKLNIRDIFNNKNYVAEEGIFRLRAEFIDNNGKTIETQKGLLVEFAYFNVSLPVQTNSNILKQEWTSETSYKIQVDGEDGTSGFLEIKSEEEPKSIIFDGIELEKNKDWFYKEGIIKIQYKHSKHEIIIEFEKYNYVRTTVIIICLVIIIIVAIKIVIMHKRRQKKRLNF